VRRRPSARAAAARRRRLQVLQRLRDEAHRFAIDHHRRLRNRLIRESALDEIPGIGPQRKQALLQAFGSVYRLARADVSAIAAVSGIGPELAAVVRRAVGGVAVLPIALPRPRTSTAVRSGGPPDHERTMPWGVRAGRARHRTRRTSSSSTPPCLPDGHLLENARPLDLALPRRIPRRRSEGVERVAR